jgi:transmembrane sensor
MARDAALSWFTTVHSGEATPAELALFQRWIGASDENRRAYEMLGALWGDLDRLGDPRQAPAADTVHPLRRDCSVSRRGLILGTAGAAAAAVVAGAVVLPNLPDGDIRTGVGEQKSLDLADGSRVELDADSALSIDFSPQARHLTLLRGRAFFDVAPDHARPFSVAAADGVTTAQGTQFSVHLWSDEVTVTVLESAVTVRAGAANMTQLHAGEAVSYDAAGFGAKETVGKAQASAWRRGKLIFEDRPLRQVMADVNRYRRGRIVVTNRDLLRLQVSGIFDVHQPDGVLEAITRTLPVRSVALTRYLVLLYPA